MDRLYTEQTATFAAGTSTSSQVDLRNRQLVAIVTDAALTTATFTFTDSHVSWDTKLAVLDAAGAAVNLTGILASKKYVLSYLGTEGLEYVALTSSIPQVAATSIRLILKERV